MRRHQPVEVVAVGLDRLALAITHGVARHRDGDAVRRRDDGRPDALEGVGGSLRLGGAAVEAVVEGEERLAHGVGVRDACHGVREGEAVVFGVWRARDRGSSRGRWLHAHAPPLSTKVIWRTPHPMRQRATAQPSVPAPISRHFVAATLSVCSDGIRRQRISLRLRSTELSARATGSICAERSIRRGPSLPLLFFSQPTMGGGYRRRLP